MKVGWSGAILLGLWFGVFFLLPCCVLTLFWYHTMWHCVRFLKVWFYVVDNVFNVFTLMTVVLCCDQFEPEYTCCIYEKIMFMSLPFATVQHQENYLAVVLALFSYRVLIVMWLFATHMKTWVTFSSHHFVSTLCYIPTWTMWFIASRDFYGASGVKVSCRSLNTKVEISSDDLNDVYYIRSMSKTQVKMNFVNPKKFAGPCVREGSLLNDIDGRILPQCVRFWSFKAYCAGYSCSTPWKRNKLSFMYETISRHFQLLSGCSHFDVGDVGRSLANQAWDCDYVSKTFPESRIRQEGGSSETLTCKRFPNMTILKPWNTYIWWIPRRYNKSGMIMFFPTFKGIIKYSIEIEQQIFGGSCLISSRDNSKIWMVQ